MGEGRRLLGAGTAALEGFDPEKYFGPQALQGMFEQATTTSFLPQLRQLQSRNASRGIRGPLAGALEGDLTSSFQRNLMAEVGRNRGQAASMAFGRGETLAGIGGTLQGQGISLLGTELELQLAREQMKRQEEMQKRRGWGMLLGGIAGTVLGPAGTAIGSQVGGWVENQFSGGGRMQ